jgi:chemotaxis protein histidine kinase CheA
MTKSELLDKIERLKKNVSVPEAQKNLLLAKYNRELAALEEEKEEPKKKAEEKPKSEPKPKAERKPKSEPKSTAKPKALDDYFDKECDDLREQAKERKAKSKAAAEKRASQPKKSQATKNKEAVEKTAERVETNVEKRAKKGDVSLEEIRKIIAQYEEAIRKLKALLKKAEEKKMARGGGVDAEEVEHLLMKAQGVKEHHCGCSDKKMAKGGGVGGSSDKMYSAKKAGKRTSHQNSLVQMKNGKSYYRRNENQYGKVEGGGTYYENRKDHSDRGKYLAQGGDVDSKKRKVVRSQFEEEEFEYGRGGKTKPKMVRTQFEEEEYEYRAGGGIGSTPYSFDVTATNSKGVDIDKIQTVYADSQKEAKEILMGFLSEKLHYTNIKIANGREGHEKVPQFTYAKGGGVGGSNDKMYAAKKAGKRTSHQNTLVHMKNGKSYYRRNENQYGKVEGGKTYYENRKDHSDKGKFL